MAENDPNPVPPAHELPPMDEVPPLDELDLSLLDASLAMTPWERMQANDDAANFGEMLRTAMLNRNAKPE